MDKNTSKLYDLGFDAGFAGEEADLDLMEYETYRQGFEDGTVLRLTVFEH